MSQVIMLDVSERLDCTCVGIDFGTTNSSVAICDDDGLQVVAIDGRDMIPSVAIYNSCQVKSIKRIISNIHEVAEYGPNGKIEDGIPYLHLDGEWRSVISVAANILRHLRHKTNQYLNRNIRNAVITVPARFDERQRQWAVEAANEAGWRVVRVMAEPTAAFLSEDIGEDGIYGVYDLGGGTFDFSILRKDGDIIQVLGSSGDVSIGGDHFDRALSQYGDMEAVRSMREGGMIKNFGPCKEMIAKTLVKCEALIQKCKVKLDKIIMVGGGVHMDFVVSALRTLKIPLQISQEPQLAVAKGAAIHAHRLSKGSIYLLIDVVPLSIGVETLHGMVEWVIHKDAPLPAGKSVIFTNADDRQTHIIFNIVQGESIFAEECAVLGSFKVPITPSRRNTAQVELELILDVNGMLSISCKDLGSNVEREFSFNSGDGLTKNMIDRMINKGRENVVEKENWRRFYRLCDEIDITLRGLQDHDVTRLTERRGRIKTVSEAEELMGEIEARFGGVIAARLCESVEKLL